jgi:hypothetical protein
MAKSGADGSGLSRQEKVAALERALRELEEQFPNKQGLPNDDDAPEGRSFESVKADAQMDEARRKAKEAEDAWIRNPPWFSFYDPFHSFMSGSEPAFRDHKGTLLEFRGKSAAKALLRLGAQVAAEYLQDCTLSEAEWRKALKDWKQLAADIRDSVPIEKIQWVDELGRPVAGPEHQQIDPFNAALILTRAVSTRLRQAEDPQEREDSLRSLAIAHHLWCVISLSEIDDAVLAALYEDAGDGVSSAIRATEALANARALNPGKKADELPFNTQSEPTKSRPEIAAIARQAKNAARYAAQDWVWDEWVRLRGPDGYDGNKTAFAKHYAHLVRQRFANASGDPLEISEKQLREVWLKGPREGRED